MNKILVADIFGKTCALSNIAQIINATTIVDPYDGENMAFANETLAYNYFTEKVGIDNYRQKLISILEKLSGECILIGFSVGAAIIWTLSGEIPVHLTKKIKFAICYYGAQIRHYTEKSPTFDLRCIFPKSELHFDVTALHNTIINKDNVSSIQVDYLHGFMNIYSPNFNEAGYKSHLSLLQQQIND